MLIRIVYIIAGFISLFLGILGIFVPGLPTTPFLLLSAFLFARGSKRIHQWLIQNRFVGRYITQWQKSRGLTLRTKIKSVVLMAVVASISVIFLIDSTIARVIVALAGLIGVFVMGFIIPTIRED